MDASSAMQDLADGQLEPLDEYGDPDPTFVSAAGSENERHVSNAKIGRRS
jgi:hypothetical protein